MKKILSIFWIAALFLLMGTGCGSNDQELQAEFSALLDTPMSSEQVLKTSEFLQKHINRFHEDDAAKLVMAYEDYLIRYISENPDGVLLQDLMSYYDSNNMSIDGEKLEEGQLSTFYEQLKNCSLTVAYYEDAMVLRVDYLDLIDRYGSRLPDSLVQLYELSNEVERNPISENAILKVDWNQLLERAQSAETLIKTYPEDERILTDALWIYTTHISAILMGTTNTPIFDYETQEFRAEAKSAFLDYLYANPDTTLSWVLTEYFTYLHSIDYKLDFKDSTMSKVFFETCDWLVQEAEKRVFE